MQIKEELNNEIMACALLLARQVQHTDHHVRFNAASILAMFAVHSKFLSGLAIK